MNKDELLSAVFVLLRCWGFLLPFTLTRMPLRQHENLLLAAALAVGAFSTLQVKLQQYPANASVYLAGVSEVACGAVLALPFALLLEVCSMGARLLDSSRGALLAEQLLPGLEQRSSSLEALSSVALCFSFLNAGLHRPVLRILYQSFEFPPGLILERAASIEFFISLLRFSQSALLQALLFVSPVILGIFLADLAVTLMNRHLPRLALTAEYSCIRLVLGIFLAGELLRYGPPAASWLMDGLLGAALSGADFLLGA